MIMKLKKGLQVCNIIKTTVHAGTRRQQQTKTACFKPINKVKMQRNKDKLFFYQASSRHQLTIDRIFPCSLLKTCRPFFSFIIIKVL